MLFLNVPFPMFRSNNSCCNDEQDIRKLGGLFNYYPSPLLYDTWNFSLTGFPFLAGYYSKDLILETAFTSSTWVSLFFLLQFCCIFNSFYSIRSLYLVFFQKISSIPKVFVPNISEDPYS